MKKLLTLLLLLAAFCSEAQITPKPQKPPQPKIDSSTLRIVQSAENQPIYLTLASEAKTQQSSSTNYVLIAAVIAALASLVSAFIGFKSKDREFKNDYYKKMIDKRLAAYEKVESIIADLGIDIYILDENRVATEEKIKAFFRDDASFRKFFDRLDTVNSKSLWLSGACRLELKNLFNKLSDIMDDISTIEGGKMETDSLVQKGIDNYEYIDAIDEKLRALIKREIVEIQDVDKFFEELHPRDSLY